MTNEHHLRRLRGVLESVKLARQQGKSLTLHKDELEGLEASLVAVLQDK